MTGLTAGRFTPEQLEIIRSIKNYLDEGFTLSAAAENAGAIKSTGKGVKRHA